ncbi:MULTISPECIES: tetratricopeptide repeat protein [Nitrosomonas]|uniref:Tetratricopeptide repeat protein n=2 Tax=Nitrosomonas eutropha TaxID=916 RepID=A0ABX5M9W6_9PROT|nr:MULTISPECIES: hypothetical protein [Nitrosomonas]ABI58973.1 TPR repeat [Nitrosomonas eutropha C91]MXS79843.1 hypothetical protein [Nitrosomonas sp. GH22]PXV82199.1 hypothetical protein C8R14_10921 [Nitrosomonas eutropha]SEI81542.1 hypothetical protein SAMN05216318_11220 [Nitrosomonas eutropha]
MPISKFILVGCMLTVAGIPSAFAHTGHGGNEMPATYGQESAVPTTDESLADERQASALLNLGTHTFPVSTQNKLAQQFINQGINLAYGFNHAEAGRAFKEAARLDPGLAMAYWGQALVLGPNINAAMDAGEESLAVKLINQAKSLMTTASPKEQALIQALEKRYSDMAEARKVNDKAYADAMREVHHQFPDDPDIAMLYVESTMDLRPWGYWMRDGYPFEGTNEIVALTEDMLRRYPNHPGALHMYIHLMEPTSNPERAEQAADKLLTLMPQAGHMIHMASHIYQRVGRYADAVKSNQMAIKADEEYIAQFKAQGLYPVVYYPHNIHFLWFAASASGQYALALKSARDAASKVDDKLLSQMPFTAIFRVLPYWTLARFGQWQSVLAEPAPPADNAFLTGSWHYVRGLAYIAMGQLQQAGMELAQLHKIVKDPSLNTPLLSQNTAYNVLRIAPEVLAGELAAAHGKLDVAIAHLERAVRLEDGLVYTEPAEWHYPPRLALGAILLEADRPDEAETVYWEDLRRNRDNGWALFGLQQALRAQNKTVEADVIKARFQKAWEHADIPLSASRMGW